MRIRLPRIFGAGEGSKAPHFECAFCLKLVNVHASVPVARLVAKDRIEVHEGRTFIKTPVRLGRVQPAHGQCAADHCVPFAIAPISEQWGIAQVIRP